jgi:hypothetical protein
MKRLKRVLNPLFYRILDVLGSDIRDVQTGECIGRALLVPWRGRILMLGRGVAGASLLPKFYPQRRLTFWKVELGFSQHPAPDFPHEPRS